MKLLLEILLAFVSATAIVSSFILAYEPDGFLFMLDLSILKNTIFSDFLIPAIILFCIGLLHYASYRSLNQNVANWFSLSIFSGLSIAGWIIVQMLMINIFFPLQYLYMAIGFLILFLAYQLEYY
jgi:hypothetical protein